MVVLRFKYFSHKFELHLCYVGSVLLIKLVLNCFYYAVVIFMAVITLQCFYVIFTVIGMLLLLLLSCLSHCNCYVTVLSLTVIIMSLSCLSL